MQDAVKPVSGAKDSVCIQRLPNGGYVVTEASIDRGYYASPLLATLNVEEALAFVRHMLTGEALPDVWPKP